MSKPAVRKRASETAPTTENETVIAFPTAEGSTPEQPRREWLTEKEVTQLCDVARARGRWGHRDATMILMCYRHGLRVSELVALRWDQVDLDAGRLTVIRRKGSDDSVQPLSGVPGDMMAADFGHRKSSSPLTRRWREMDLNYRSLVR
jgi:integrase